VATSILLIILGLLLLVAGGEILLRGAVALALLLRLTPAIIGLTIVAFGTSIPELAVSAIAAARGYVDISVSNVVGSNIFNLTFLLGLTAIIRPLVISGNTIKLEYPVMVIVTLMCLAVSQDGTINWLDALLFITVYVGFTVYSVSLVRGKMNETEVGEYQAEVSELSIDNSRNSTLWKSIGLVSGGVALLGFGAQVTVNSAVDLARLIGLSERIIGLTIIAGGTGLPEIVTSIVSALRGRDDVAIGNVIGSNLFNILGTLGLSSLVAPLAVNPNILRSDNWWMLGLTLLIFPLMHTGSRINRREGALLFAAYIVYLVLLIGY